MCTGTYTAPKVGAPPANQDSTDAGAGFRSFFRPLLVSRFQGAWISIIFVVYYNPVKESAKMPFVVIFADKKTKSKEVK